MKRADLKIGQRVKVIRMPHANAIVKVGDIGIVIEIDLDNSSLPAKVLFNSPNYTAENYKDWVCGRSKRAPEGEAWWFSAREIHPVTAVTPIKVEQTRLQELAQKELEARITRMTTAELLDILK